MTYTEFDSSCWILASKPLYSAANYNDFCLILSDFLHEQFHILYIIRFSSFSFLPVFLCLDWKYCQVTFQRHKVGCEMAQGQSACRWSLVSSVGTWNPCEGGRRDKNPSTKLSSGLYIPAMMCLHTHTPDAQWCYVWWSDKVKYCIDGVIVLLLYG